MSKTPDPSVVGPELCKICRTQTHMKWHDLAKEELNPVALIEWINALDVDGVVSTKARILGYILAVTGIDYAAMERELSAERQR